MKDWDLIFFRCWLRQPSRFWVPYSYPSNRHLLAPSEAFALDALLAMAED